MSKKKNANPKLKRKSGDAPKKKSRSNHSLNPERKVSGKTSGNGPTMRSKSTINRLRMYKNFKPVRDSKGKILKSAPFQGKLKSGTVARVEPHRKWFGNTRVVGQEQLQRFQEEMGKVLHNPFQVVMRQTRAPISLLQEKAKQQRVHVLDTESFEHTFGRKAQRKRAILKATDLEELCEEVVQKSSDYVEDNDRSLMSNQQRALEERTENPTPLFRAGQSARVWSELYKVIDSSDVVIEVLDARDPKQFLLIE
uniref:NGP1NT domain-containing protein n=1 Tax=Globodera pallida TaxID=36090 RepID=A0A183CCX5_GLOPA